MKRVRYKHPLALRWFHWINFPLLALMIWSGLLIYWANSVYNLRIGGTVVFHFFPKNFYANLNVPYRLAEGMNWHFAIMWLFAINGFLYILYTIFSGEWRYLLPNKSSFKEAWLVLLKTLGFKIAQKQYDKYNAAQRIAYTSIIIMGLGSLITGLAIYKPVQLSTLTFICGGYGNARLIHFILTIGYVLFFVVHIIQVLKAGWNNFQSMITGVEVIEKPPVNTIDNVEKQEKSNS